MSQLNEAEWPALGAHTSNTPTSKASSTAAAPHKTAKASSMAGLDYTSCSTDELKAFITSRKIPCLLGKLVVKHCLIRPLERADPRTQFRFFDLAPELRNQIYEELLRFKPGRQGCHPKILATCSKVREEAGGILYELSVFELNVINLQYTEPENMFSSKSSLAIQCEGCERHVSSDFDDKHVGTRVWPSFMLRMRQLKLVLGHPPCWDKASIQMYLPSILLSFALFLQESKALRSLEIVGDITHLDDPMLSLVDEKEAAFIFRPEARLLAIFDCSMHDFSKGPDIPNALAEYAKQNQALFWSSATVTTTLLHDEIAAWFNILRYGSHNLGDLHDLLDYIEATWFDHLTGAPVMAGPRYDASRYLASIVASWTSFTGKRRSGSHAAAQQSALYRKRARGVCGIAGDC